ncbi:MAG: heme-binding protein [Clostridiales Family XIII bacterium]|jgi:uncharacterized protein (UPF0303 family)|nr:heme-binding protein [Clostridiales Family XIII bacterium]
MSYKNIEIQEELLQLDHFSNEDAVAIGILIYERAKELGYAMAIDISRGGLTLFHLHMDGTGGQESENWMRRKRNTVYYFQKSSLRFETPETEGGIEGTGLNRTDYAPAGGGFPIFVKGIGFAGAAIASGLAGIDDHNLVVWAICKHYGIEGCPNAEIV